MTLVSIAVLLGACTPSDKRVVVVTSAALAGTGLPQQMVSTFVAESHANVALLILDEESLVKRVRKGGIDVAIVNSPLVNELRRFTTIQLQNTFAYDDFVIAGPKRDPAHVSSAENARDAFRRIADSRTWFCSPAQIPAFRGREAEIWRGAGVDPHEVRRWVQCKGNPESVLNESARRGAYTLTDRSTFENSRAARRLTKLKVNAPLLHNDITVALLEEPGRNRDADWFVQWLMSYRGRDLIEGYRFEDGRRFYTSDAR